MILNIPTEAFAAFQWVTLASIKDKRSPILGNVKLDYAPDDSALLSTLTMIATDRFRVHRVIVNLPPAENNTDENGEAEAWSRIIPARIFVEAARHATVGRSVATLLPFTVTESRIEAGLEGWVANFVPNPGNYPPVGRLIGDPTDVEQGPITLNMTFLADLAKWPLGDKQTRTWTLTWNRTDKDKPGPVLASRVDDHIAATALIQPNLLLNR